MAAKVAVVVGIVIDANQKILIAQRPEGKHLSGLWEFPGGKVEAGETAINALQRELQEEVDLEVIDTTPLIKLDYDYGEKQVHLDVYIVDQYKGIAYGREQQQIKWVSFSELEHYPFPQANEKIITALGKNLA